MAKKINVVDSLPIPPKNTPQAPKFEVGEFLKAIGKSDVPQTVEEANEMLRAEQALAEESARASKPFKLGDILDKTELQRAVPTVEGVAPAIDPKKRLVEEYVQSISIDPKGRGQQLNEVLSKPHVEDLINHISVDPSKVNKGVTRPIDPNFLPVPTQSEAGFQTVGEPVGGNVAKIPETKALTVVPGQVARTRGVNAVPDSMFGEVVGTNATGELPASMFGDVAGEVNTAKKVPTLMEDIAKYGSKAVEDFKFANPKTAELIAKLAGPVATVAKPVAKVAGKVAFPIAAADMMKTAYDDAPGIMSFLTDHPVQTMTDLAAKNLPTKPFRSYSHRMLNDGVDVDETARAMPIEDRGMADSLQARSHVPVLPAMLPSNSPATPPSNRAPSSEGGNKPDKSNTPDKEDKSGNGKGGNKPPKTDIDSGLGKIIAQTQKNTQNGYGDGLDDAALKAAQEQAAHDMGMSMFGKGLNNIIAGATKGFKTYDDVYNDMQKNSQQGVQDILTRRKAKDDSRKFELEQRLEDPNSPESSLTREMLRKANVNVPNDVSAGALKRAGIDVDSVLNRALQREQIASNRELARQDKFNKELEKKQERELALAVPGFERTGKILPKPEEAVKFRSSVDTVNQLQQKLTRMKQLVGENGSFEFFGPAGQEMQSLATEIQLLSKNKDAYDLGVLTGPDLSLLQKITADPDSLKSLFTRNKTRNAQIDSQLKSIQLRLDSKAKSLGYRKEGSSSSSGDEPSEFVTVLDPKGTPRKIPKNKLQAALKAGGKLVE
jgi:hypothetical protein